jgi:hypothetical protein
MLSQFNSSFIATLLPYKRDESFAKLKMTRL